MESNQQGSFPDGRHHLRPARHDQADRLCAVISTAQSDMLPWEVQQDRRALSSWIDAQAKLKPVSALDQLPSSKQVAFAERLARIKRRAVPDECFRDKGLMSKWIDGNR